MPYIELGALENFAVNCAMNISSRKMASSGRLGRLLGRKLRTIRAISDELSANPPSSAKVPKAVEWVADNRYLAEREGRGAAAVLKNTGKLPGSKKGVPKAFVLAQSLVQSGEGALDSSRIEVFLRGTQKPSEATEQELWLFTVFLKAALIFELYDLALGLKAYLSTFEGNAPATPDPETGVLLTKRAQNLFTSLRLLINTDFTPMLHTLSTVEHILSTDPASVYPLMDEESRAHYRRIVRKLSVKHRCSEKEAALRAIRLSERATESRKQHVGYYLIDEPLGAIRGSLAGSLYFIALFCLTALFSLLLYPVAGLFSSILLILPLSDLAKNLVDSAAMKLRHPKRLPRLDLHKGIPAHACTLCVISGLLASPANGPEYASLLEKYMYANRNAGPNLLFGILGDFRDSDIRQTDLDREVLQAAQKAIDALNTRHGPRFFLFTREKVFNEIDQHFMAWERKRGALLELTNLLLGKPHTILIQSGDPSRLKNIRYVITLDADTSLTIGAASELVGAMLHPLNQPVFDPQRRVVTQGHALLQPRISVDLESASKSFFSRAFAGLGGTDPYNSTVSDLYQDLFDEGSFTGKGIFDVAVFSACLGDRFPENRILSHDLLEGCYLRSGLLSDVELTDGFPSTVASYFKRQHRWIRGDWQLLDWLRPMVPLSNKTFEKNPLSPLSKWKILDNLRRSMTPIFIFAALFSGMLFGHLWTSLIVALAIYLSGLLLTTCSAFLRGGAELGSRYHSSILFGVRGSAAQTLLQLMLLPYHATQNLHAILTTLYRLLISKKRLLTWVTAAQAANSSPNSILSLYRTMIVSPLFGLVGLLASGQSISVLISLLWILSPIVASGISGATKYDRPLSQEDRDFLLHEASLIWAYFKDLLNEKSHFLPPDNWQEHPATGIAQRTSPTNIGLGLLSCLAAIDLGFEDLAGGLQKLEKTLNTLERMEKWYGHLLNWYETDTLKPLHPYTISSVDSGNLAACMVALEQGLRAFPSPEAAALADRVLALFSAMDFLPLYDRDRKLFYISRDMETGAPSEGWYDLLASEARQTSYLCIAKGLIEKKHWSHLGRTLVQKNGYAGMASWTGTMFEYLMPNLLMPAYRNSLIYESLMFCVYCQKLRGRAFRIPWGISESSYFAFDRSMNYQYKAHGVQRLGFKRGLNRELVISPYSTFLALTVAPRESIRNLQSLRSIGMEGRYGLYEAADFTPNRLRGRNRFEKVRCYMAHHLGMSLIACANVLHENIMQKRFMADPEIAAYAELLQQRTPVDAIKVSPGFREIPEKRPRFAEGGWSRAQSGWDATIPRCTLLSNGSYSLMLTDTGLSVSKWNDWMLTLFESNQTEGVGGMFFLIRSGGQLHPLTPAPLFCEDIRYSSEFDERGAKFYSQPMGLHCTISVIVSAMDNAELREVKIHTDKPFSGDLLCYFEPVLADPREYFSHPTFSKMGIETEKLESGLLLKRRDRNGAYPLFAAFKCSESGFSFDTSRERAIGRGGLRRIEQAAKHTPSGTLGSVLDPCVFLTIPLKLEAGDVRTIRFALSCAHTPSDAETDADRALTLPYTHGSNQLFLEAMEAGMSPADFSAALDVLTDLYFLTPSRKSSESFAQKNRLGQADLWRFGISGDLPMLTVHCPPVALAESVRRVIRQHRILSQNGARFDLVLLLSDMSDYSRPTKNSIVDFLRQCGAERTIGIPGGLHFVDCTPESPEYALFCACSFKIIGPESMQTAHSIPSVPKWTPTKIVRAATGTPALRNSRYEPDGSFVFFTGGTLPPVAWSNMLAGQLLGSITTETGGSSLWLLNARMSRIHPWRNDPLQIEGDEHLYISSPVGLRSLFSSDDRFDCTVRYGYGYTVWEKFFEDGRAKTTSFVHQTLPLRFLLVEWSGPRSLSLRYQTRLQLGETLPVPVPLTYTMQGETVLIHNNYNALFRDSPVFFHSIPPQISFDSGPVHLPGLGLDLSLKEGVQLIVTGVGKPDDISALCGGISLESAKQTLSEIQAYWKSLVSPITIRTPSESIDHYFNGWALYQTIACRIFGRSSIYQSGGAYGFRDQLQDARAAVYADPEIARSQILRAARHQYVEGDVQHWWHPEIHSSTADKGVRTRYSDDLLWLPYTVAGYLEMTGDADLLSQVEPFLCSPPLRPDEHERYEIPTRSEETGTLYEHCVRAIEQVFTRGTGAHGLCLIGSGDWNDGFNRVGEKSMGESTWLSWFFSIVLRRFSVVCGRLGDAARQGRYLSAAEEYVRSAETAWDGAWFVRGFYDDGSALGSSGSDECKIDSIAQSFSVLAGCDPEKGRTAVNSALELLFDREAGVVKLFDPPFRNTTKNPGYIKGYPEGVRENGGQYTHAAIWLALSCFELGLADAGLEILEKILPAAHSEKIYRCEPFVLAADIYASKQHLGKGGWSWYTGSAAWYYTTVCEALLGIRIREGCLTVNPCLPSSWEDFEASVRFGPSVWKVCVKRTGSPGLTVDGTPLPVGSEVPPGQHEVQCTL